MPSRFDEAFAQAQPLVADFDANKGHYLSPAYQESEVRADFLNKLFIALAWDVNHETKTMPISKCLSNIRNQSMRRLPTPVNTRNH
jgi:hypothetical protein